MPNTRRLADYVQLHRGHNTTFSVYVSPTACNVVGGCTHAENQMTIDLVILSKDTWRMGSTSPTVCRWKMCRCLSAAGCGALRHHW